MRAIRIAFLAVACFMSRPVVIAAQIYDLRELDAEQIQQLPLDRTAVIIPGGILEEHGPYLPSYTDGYSNEYVARRLAEAIVARPGWVAVIFPSIPLGVGGFNQVGLKQVFPGTYHVHPSTLRAVFMDLATELGEAGFRWVFIVHEHGAPDHSRALHQAADFFCDTYGGRMAHLADLINPSSPPLPPLMSDDARNENGLGVHSDAFETSRMLFLRPDLVNLGYRDAVPHAGRTWTELVDTASQKDFPGYVGSPRLATAAIGAEILQRRSESTRALALRILDGLDPRTLKRTVDQQQADPGIERYNNAAQEHDRRVQQVQRAWLTSKGVQ